MSAAAVAIQPPPPLDTDLWLTPAPIIDRVLQVFGRIDLDPCADEAHSVPAVRHYTQSDNGLIRPWAGKVFANPPYSRPLLGMFVDKMMAELAQPQSSIYGPLQVILLIPARSDTEWFQPLWSAQALCFVKGRLHFSGSKGCGRFASALAYFGTEPWKFEGAFTDMGRVIRL